jgi:hypothetical protein
MKVNPATLSDAERADYLAGVIGSERFLKREGLGNEVPFFICPFEPRSAFIMAKMVDQLANRLGTQSPPVRVLVVNLYDLSIEILKERNLWERILRTEESLDKAQLKELLQNVLDPEKHLAPAIAERMARSAFDVLFLTGAGEVFPYIRSHNVLNNLQKVAKDRPAVLFFPGEYIQSDDKGASLVLFGRLGGDQYYRAFNIYHVEAVSGTAIPET